jgi:GTP cyclohydrolase I
MLQEPGIDQNEPPKGGLPQFGDHLHDEQQLSDERGLHIDKVGVSGLRFPIEVCDRTSLTQSTVATIAMYVDLDQSFKGTHMSRFIEVLNSHGSIISVDNISELLHEMKDRLNSKNSYLEIEFPYFISKKAPVTQQAGLIDYKVHFDVSLINEGIDFVMTLKVPVTTLCPCSKAISEYGAHNQRGEVSVSIRSNETVWIEDLIKIVESCASSELYSLLKRVDEKAVTERAYENPVFVEDLVRNVVTKLKTDSTITWYKAEAENYESIHNHNAYACIESG